MQYQADKTDDIDRALTEGQGVAGLPLGSTSSETETASTVGSEETLVQQPFKCPQATAPRSVMGTQKTAMQCCLEYFQQFLTRFITLYIIPKSPTSQKAAIDLPEEPIEAQTDGTKWEMPTSDNAKEKNTIKPISPKEYRPAFIAACQLFLECSSFPVYIAEGSHPLDIHSDKLDGGKMLE